MKKINQVISEAFNQETESFEEIYAFPEKLFHLFGNSFNLHFSEDVILFIRQEFMEENENGPS